LKIVRKQITGAVVGADTDKVVAWAPVPEGGKVLSVQGALHIQGAEEKQVQQIYGYGFSGEVAPMVDPDFAGTLDTLWDYEVTKPSDVQVVAGGSLTTGLEFDWDTALASPDVEPGQLDVNAMLNAFTPTKSLIEPRLEIVSYMKNNNGTYHEEESADDQWMPTDYKTFRSRRKVKAESGPAYAMLAFSSPTFDQEETAPDLVNDLKEWTMLGNLDSILQDMWKIQAGAMEAGAIEPYASAAKLIEKLVAPPIVQPGTAILVPQTWTVLTETTWLLDFPEQQALRMLRGENM